MFIITVFITIWGSVGIVTHGFHSPTEEECLNMAYEGTLNSVCHEMLLGPLDAAPM